MNFFNLRFFHTDSLPSAAEHTKRRQPRPKMETVILIPASIGNMLSPQTFLSVEADFVYLI